MFVDTLRSDLQFVLCTEYIPPLSLRVGSSLAKEVCEFCGRNDLAQPSGGSLEVVPAERRQ